MLIADGLRFLLRFESRLGVEVRFVSQLDVCYVFIVKLLAECEVLVLAVNILVIIVDFDFII